MTLVWELAYCELVYLDVAWPDLRGDHLESGDRRVRRSAPTFRRARLMGSPVYRDAAVVLRTYRLAEADRIVVLMTEHHGKVRAVAKGVRKTKSKFGARLEPMSHVQLLLAHGRTDLDIVSQAESIETLAPMVADLDHMTNGIAMLEAVDQLALEREPAPHLYRMLVGALRTVARRSGPLVVPAFYWKLLAAEGITPLLDECARCGEPGPLVRLRHGPGRRPVPQLPHRSPR